MADTTIGDPSGTCAGTNSHITNQGLIAAHEPGSFAIVLRAQSAVTTSTIVNSGTIDADDAAIFRHSTSTETNVLQNSGLISGITAYGAGLFGRDLITNTGQMIGDILLGAANDVYNGAQGRLSGDVFGGADNDVITGGIDSDTFFGDAGNDTLNGGAGIDTLDGGAGVDTLRGGVGRDILTGGADRDFFDFNSTLDSAKGANRDVITDFSRAVDDRIDLSGIDADTSANSGNDSFKFIGRDAFKGGGGELRYTDNGSTCYVQGDINGDKKADFEIKVNIGSLVSGDFFL